MQSFYTARHLSCTLNPETVDSQTLNPEPQTFNPTAETVKPRSLLSAIAEASPLLILALVHDDKNVVTVANDDGRSTLCGSGAYSTY